MQLVTRTNLLSINRNRRFAHVRLKHDFVAHRQKEDKEGGWKGKGRKRWKEEKGEKRIKTKETLYIPTYFGNLGVCDSVQFTCAL